MKFDGPALYRSHVTDDDYTTLFYKLQEHMKLYYEANQIANVMRILNPDVYERACDLIEKYGIKAGKKAREEMEK